MGYSDAEIIQAISSGNDRDALKYLYKTLFPKVKKYICENSGNNDAAFDIFQDSILVFYKYVTTNKFDTKFEIAGFVFTVSKNLWINQIRKDKREMPMPEYFDCSDTCDDIMEHLITKEREKEVSYILSQLGTRCEELLRYSVFYKLKNNEICKKMGFSTENAVKTRKYKCMQKLISLIESKPSLKQAMQEL
jgi:RNA polymerase sigma factor (sigma-70 family)